METGGKRILARTGEGILRLLFPQNCVPCGAPVGGDGPRYLCPACADEVQWLNDPLCAFCGAAVALSGQERCEACAHIKKPVLAMNRSLFAFEGVGRALVHTLKYRNGAYLLPDLAALTQGCPWLEDYAGGAALVPVPLHGRRLRERGYNQSLLIARTLAAVIPGAVVVEAIARVKDTSTQTRLTREERERNVANAFALKRNQGLKIAGGWVLVDDVFTTGSTLNACAKVLRDHGARAVSGLTLAHG